MAAGVNSTVLRLLAIGVPPARVTDQMSERRMPRFSTEDLRAVLDHAAVVARQSRLLPPAEAAFFGRSLLPPAGRFGDEPGVELSVSDLAGLRVLAIDLLERYLAEDTDSIELPDPKRDAMQSAALQYVEALLHQEEVIEDLNKAAADETSLHAALRGSDRTRIDAFVLNRGGTRLDSLVDRWQRCVKTVETDPARLMYEEYENWLSARDSLEDARSLLTPPCRAILDPRLEPLDERFLRATREVSTSIRPRSPWEPQRWWWFRVPRNLGEHFKDYLEHFVPLVAEEASSDPGE
jgi:hypothetical protein